jgi:hypothetical protein
MFSDPRGQIRKAAECIPISGDQFPAAGLDVRRCWKPSIFNS